MKRNGFTTNSLAWISKGVCLQMNENITEVNQEE
jgi:hypothetical protein